jgi:predicted N-formylglutamate amidohydrolase
LTGLARQLVISCEHGGNRVPPAYRHLFQTNRRLLESHRGWDPGALECANRLASKLKAPLISGRTSRLLIDLNRSLQNRNVFSRYTHNLPPEERRAIINTIYLPYRLRLQAIITKVIRRYGFAAHFSIHSFVPVLNGRSRDADIGILYDPGRRRETALASRLLAQLKVRNGQLRIRRNYPYRGSTDGATTHFRKLFADQVYAGVEIEINQRFPRGPDRKQWRALQETILQSLNSLNAV